MGSLLSTLQPITHPREVIVADGGRTDGTRGLVDGFDGVQWLDAPTGRARQMNAGAGRAGGDILLFLHADTRLPPGWPGEVARVSSQPQFALGAFRFALDQPGFAYQIIEWGVQLRCSLFRLPYGDQALFTRREHFQAIGGFRDQPLLEDVELVRDLRRHGRFTLIADPATTSARRWERRGAMRQTWMNWTTRLLYQVGATPAYLARRYGGTRDRALILFCKYPTPGTVKTRLAATEGESAATRIYRVLVDHTLDCALQLRDQATLYAFFSPIDAANHMPAWLGRPVQYRPQSTGDLGERMLDAFRQLYHAGVGSTVIVGTDCPGLSANHLRSAFAALESADLVLGPTLDGGYYLIGLRQPLSELFQDIAWSTDSVLNQTQAAADRLGLTVTLLDPLRDLDTVDDLAAAREETGLTL